MYMVKELFPARLVKDIIFSYDKGIIRSPMSPIHLYNTLTRSLELFTPKNPSSVGLYTCGPTVYHYAHLGNLRTYIFEDVLKRTLQINGFTVTHVMNITDVGHLTDDADQGEDKMEKGSRREGKTAWDVAKFYTDAFLRDIHALNILPPTVLCRATDHIPEQIAQVQTLIDKGHTYETIDGIYFDTTTISDYGKLAQLDKQHLEAGARVDMGEKKNTHDFALWKFTPPGEKRQMEWDAFGRKGFPGWHIECSAMSIKYLGEQFDIHCGGVDHIPVHHTNEIAQAEATTGKKPWVTYWLHGEFLLTQHEKMAKSGENFFTLESIINDGIDPLAYRYFVLQTSYRKQANFTIEALRAAEQGLRNLRDQVARLPDTTETHPEVCQAIIDECNNDLNTPKALGILWEHLKKGAIGLNDIETLEPLFGLQLIPTKTIPNDVHLLLEERAIARQEKRYKDSDTIREKITSLGYDVEDTPQGQRLIPRS